MSDTPLMRHGFSVYGDRRALVLLMLGFAAGLPYFLIFSSLSLWLSEAGATRSEITMFSWVALAYSFKFVWAPLIDSLPLPYLTQRLGRRRAWLFTAQIMIVLALCVMALINPQTSAMQKLMAAGAVLLAFSSATQDIVIDAYRIERGEDDLAMQPVMASTYTAGYRIGMMVSGAGALFLADFFGSSKTLYAFGAWQATYFIMAGVMALCAVFTLAIREPDASKRISQAPNPHEHLRLLLLFIAMIIAFIAAMILSGKIFALEGVQASAIGQYVTQHPLGKFLKETLRLVSGLIAAALVAWALVRSHAVPGHIAQRAWLDPIADFFARYGKRALLLLALIGFYRIADIVAGVIANLFYEHLGFSKTDIAAAAKTFGLFATLAGGFIGGIFAQRYTLMKMMMIGAVLTAATNLLFILLEQSGANLWMFYGVIGFDNLAAGFATTIFVAFLSALTSIRFTAVQYAIFSSLMTLVPKIIGGYSGAMIDALQDGYTSFFLITAGMGIPVLFLIWLNDRYIFSVQKQ